MSRLLSVVKYKGRSKNIDKDIDYVVVATNTRDPDLATYRLSWYHGSRIGRVTIVPKPTGYSEKTAREQYMLWRDRVHSHAWYRETSLYQLVYRHGTPYTVAASSLVTCGGNILEQIMYKTMTYEAQKAA